MFTENKYTKLYYKIVNHAKSVSNRSCYVEKHHIIPRSIGGNNSQDNIVVLTAREHFICHWLLPKMTTGNNRHKMIYALNMMKVSGQKQQRYHATITSRVHEKNRIELRKIISENNKGRTAWNKGITPPPEEVERLRQMAKDRPPQTKEIIEKRTRKLIGIKHSKEACLKKSLALKGKLKGPMSDENKEKISASLKGIPKPEGHGEKVREAKSGTVAMNRGGVEKHVKLDQMDKYIRDGWVKGGLKRKKKGLS